MYIVLYSTIYIPYVCYLIVVQIELEQHWQLAKCATLQYADVVVL